MMISDEQTVLLDPRGIRQGSEGLDVHMIQHLLVGEIAGYDRPVFKPEFIKLMPQCGSVIIDPLFDDHREAEPAALPGFPLNAYQFVIFHHLLEHGRITAPACHQPVKFGKLFASYRAGKLQGPHIVAGKNKTEGLEERVLVFLAGNPRDVRKVPCPTMCPQAEQNVIKVLVVGQDEAAFHRGDMVREEAAETPHGADTAGLAAGNHGTHRFTIVLYHGDIAITNEVIYRLEIIRIAKQVHRKYQPRAVTDRGRKRVEIEIQCVDIYVHKGESSARTG